MFSIQNTNYKNYSRCIKIIAEQKELSHLKSPQQNNVIYDLNEKKKIHEILLILST